MEMRKLFNKRLSSKAAKYQEIIRESVEFEQLQVARDGNSSIINHEDTDHEFHLLTKKDNR